MNGKICIDKRIAYLIVFSVPIILVIALSAALNSTRLSQNSKASEIKEEPLSVVTVKPTQAPSVAACMIPEKGAAVGTLDLSLKTKAGFTADRPIKVYSYDGKYFILLTMATLPTNISQNVLASVNTSLLNSGTTYVFLGVQGDDLGENPTREILNLAKICASYKVE